MTYNVLMGTLNPTHSLTDSLLYPYLFSTLPLPSLPPFLELSPGQSPGSRCYYRQLQALVENVFVFSVPVQLVH